MTEQELDLERSVAALLEAAERMAESLADADPEMLENYVNEREQLLENIRKEAASADTKRLHALRPIIDKVLERDRLVIRRMEELRDEAASKLQQTAKAKVQRDAYESSDPVDSYFFDRRN